MNQAQQGKAEDEYQQCQPDEQPVQQCVENEAVGADGKRDVGRAARVFLAKGSNEQRADLRHGREKNARAEIVVVIAA